MSVFESLIKERDPVDYFKRYLFPEIVGEQYDIARKAILLSLTTRKDLRKRARIHVLLVGPPGSGKTEILLWLQQKFNAYFVNAEYTTKVGLAGDARGNMVTPGILAEADGQILAIDELDKMRAWDQSALLQAMEEGKYSIVKGKHRERFTAEVRVVAAANDISKIQQPLLDRFDFIVKLRPPTKEERVEAIPILIEQFFGEYQGPCEIVLKEYLNWIRDFEPMPEQGIEKVLQSYVYANNLNKSYRSFELSVLRIAYALAKLQRKNIDAECISRALELKRSQGEV